MKTKANEVHGSVSRRHGLPQFRASARNGHAIRLAKILMPIDFSDESIKAIQYAMPLAREFGATISLVHVIEPILFPADYGYGPVMRQIPSDKPIGKMKARLAKLGKRTIGPGLLAETMVLSGVAFSEITQAAKAMETDLIIMGTHGYAGLRRAVMGSTAEKVVRHAPCPVLVVRREEHEFVSCEQHAQVGSQRGRSA